MTAAKDHQNSNLSDVSEKFTSYDKSLNIHDLQVLREISCPAGSTAVSYSDDMRFIAAGNENGSVQLFDDDGHTYTLYDSEMIQEAEPCTAIKTRAPAKNGFHRNILVTYLGGHIKLWNTIVRRSMFTMKEKRSIYGSNYHPRDSKFLTYGTDFKVYLYDEERRVTERILACSEIVGSKNGHTDSVCCAQFHPKNNFELISSGLDGTIQFWDLRAPYAVRCIQHVINYGEGIDISHDGKTILALASNIRSGAVRTYDYNSGKKLNEVYIRNTYAYCCKLLNHNYAAVGGFLEHSFSIVNIHTGEIVGSIGRLPACVMSIDTVKTNKKTHPNDLETPRIIISSGKSVIEIESKKLTED